MAKKKTSISLSELALAALDILCKKDDRSISYVIEKLILEADKKPKPPKVK
jgi:hypothetical protein